MAYTRNRPRKHSNRRARKKQGTSGWDAVSDWYDGMVGPEGSKFHQQQAIPEVMHLLNLQSNELVLDIGCGQGVLAPEIVHHGGKYTGIDVSKKLIQKAQQHHGSLGDFYHVDICNLPKDHRFQQQSFDAAIFMLSIQDIKNHEAAIKATAWALKPNSRLIIFMTHPAFRIPRQSGWGTDEQRKLMYRRIDSYLSPLDVPLRTSTRTQQTLTRSYHRPLHSYINPLAKNGLLIDVFKELPTYKVNAQNNYSRAELRAQKEIPLFLAIRATKKSD